MAKAKRPTTRQRRIEAEHKVATIKAQAEALALEKTVRLLESPAPVVVPWREYPSFDHWGMNGGGYHSYDRPYMMWTTPEDRSEGRYRPLYENALDVRQIRAEARVMVELFPIARGIIRKLSDYIIGTGWDFVAQPKKQYENDPYANQCAASVQGIIDQFLEYNNFIGNLDREIHEDSRVCGDCLPALYEDRQSGNVRVELIDPATIIEPFNPKPLEQHLETAYKLNGWWHGVHTIFNPQLGRDDVTRPLGYHCVFDNLGNQWDYLPCCRVEHIKRNVGRMARVGVPDFLVVQQDLENEAKLRRNTAVGAAILAAIVMIREHAEGTSKSSIESMVSSNSTYNYQKRTQDSSRTTYGEQIAPGTVKDIPEGMTATTGPLGQNKAPGYIEVGQHLLRIIGTAWSMPEYLVGGDASNANYASTLVAESPFVKYCEHEQAFYGSHFERLVWKAIKMYHGLGLIPYPFSVVTRYLEINAEYPSPASRDKSQMIDVDERLDSLGIKSKRSIAADYDLDYDEEQQSRSIEKPTPPKVVQAPGFGGGFGGGFSAYESRSAELAKLAVDSILLESKHKDD